VLHQEEGSEDSDYEEADSDERAELATHTRRATGTPMLSQEPMRLEPGQGAPLRTKSHNPVEVEDTTDIWHWVAATHVQPTMECEWGDDRDHQLIRLTQDGFAATKINAADGTLETDYFLHNTTDQELHLPAGTVMGYVTPMEEVTADDVLPRESEGEAFVLMADGEASKQCTNRLDRLQTPVWGWLASWGMGGACWHALLAWSAAVALLWLCTAALGAAPSTNGQFVCSLFGETEDASKGRQTTVRHRPRTRLLSNDPRRFETGEETVNRFMERMKKDSRAKTKYQEWVGEIGSKFTFGGKLKETEKTQIMTLMYAYKEVFLHNTSAPPVIDGIEYALYFRHDDPMPIRMKTPRISPGMIEHMEKDTAQMLRNHIIQFSDSEWATKPVFARKKDGTLRYAIDYRRLNDLLVGDSQAIPNIPETLEALSQAERFSAFDACAGFWGVRIRPKDRQYTAFQAVYQGSWQLFEWLRMPFGLKSATATFQRMFMRIMGQGECICNKDATVRNHSHHPRKPAAQETDQHSKECEEGFKGLINKICRIFVDDGIVYSTKAEDHINDLAHVLKRLAANGISLKPVKCVWGTDSVKLLGHVVQAGEGIKADPDKVEAILKMSKPKAVDELRRFLGMTGYLQKFIPQYSQYAEPLRDLAGLYPSKSTMPLDTWPEEVDQAYQTLKVAVAQAALLHFPDFDAPFIISTDASGLGLGACLMQLSPEGIERPIAYASTSLSKAEQNYGITHKEGLGVVWAVRKWRNYLQGNVTIIITDHSALTCLVNPNKEFDNARLARYALELSEFDIVIGHRPGEQLLAPDLLSRLLEEQDPQQLEEMMDRAVGHEAQVAMRLQDHLKERVVGKAAQQTRLHRRITGTEIRDQVGNSKASSILELVKAILSGSRTPQERQITEGEDQGKVDELYDMVCTATMEDCIQEHNCNALTRAQRATQEAQGERVIPKLVEDSDTDSTESESDSDSDSEGAAERDSGSSQTKRRSAIGVKQSSASIKTTQSEQTGGHNKVGDAENEQSKTEEDTTLAQPITLQRVIQAQMQDKFSLNMMQHLHSEGEWLPEDEEEAKQCTAWASTMVMRKGVLCRVKTRKQPEAVQQSQEGGLLAPLFQLYIPDDGRLQHDIVKAVHRELAHPGIVRTYQAVHDRFFWKGMFSRTREWVQNCLVCQFHAPKAPKAAMQGHVVATRPAEMLMMDIIHMSTVNGYAYILTVLDIFSKYGAAVPLAEASALEVTEALMKQVLPHGYGRPGHWIVDGGSEFKAVLADTVKAWGAKAHTSSPNHAQSHGAIEKYNQTLQRKLAKRLADCEAAGVATDWVQELAAVTETTNNQVQDSISNLQAAITPAEIWYARTPVLDSVPSMTTIDEATPSNYVRWAKQQWEWTKQCVQDSANAYGQRMRAKDPHKNTPLRSFNLGDEVTWYQRSKSKKQDKLTPLQKGPYRITAVQGNEYTIKRTGSGKKRDVRRVHVDDIRTLRRFDSTTLQGAHPQKSQAKPHARSYGVELIVGERGSDAVGSQKQYLVKWEGYSEHTWEPAVNLNCPEKVTEWISLSRSQRTARHNKARRIGIAATLEEVTSEDSWRELQETIHLIESNDFICYDLSQLEEDLDELMSKAKVKLAAVAAFVISPPCETYSMADSTNISRGFHYRNHSDSTRPPRSIASCTEAHHFAKRKTAIEHDQMIETLIKVLMRHRKEHKFEIVLENPVGGLAHRPFMQNVDWLGQTVKHTVNYCAYGATYKKPTHIWTTLLDWEPKGVTGSGRCESKCGQLIEGKDHDKENVSKSQRRRHIHGLAREPWRLPPGPHRKQKLWSIPQLLQQELLQIVQERQAEKTYVIDMFSGGESWRQQVENAGYNYIPVDLLCSRRDHIKDIKSK
jgi:hypothetical protein